jgi:hypothetical protein
MYKYEITFKNGSSINVESEIAGIYTLSNELESRQGFIRIDDVIVRKSDILYVREVKDDE